MIQASAKRATRAMVPGSPAARARGDPGPLETAGEHPGFVGRVVGARERGGRLAEEQIEEFDELGQTIRVARPGTGRSPPRTVESKPTPPAPTPRIEAALRDVVEGHGVLGQRHRMTEIGRRHHGAQPDGAGGGGQAGQPGDGGVPGAVAVATPRQMVVRPEMVESEGFETPGPGRRLGPRVGREHEDADPHPCTVPVAVAGVGPETSVLTGAAQGRRRVGLASSSAVDGAPRQLALGAEPFLAHGRTPEVVALIGPLPGRRERRRCRRPVASRRSGRPGRPPPG